jgi:hypothetical protein
MACLARGRDQIAAFVDALRSIDAGQLDHAASQADTIADLEACSDAQALAEVVPPPRNPRIVASMEELEHEVARAEALGHPGNFKDPVRPVLALVQRAQGSRYRRSLRPGALGSGELAYRSPSRNGTPPAPRAAAYAASLARDDHCDQIHAARELRRRRRRKLREQ